MSYQYPNIKINYEVSTDAGKQEGEFQLADGGERRAFLERQTDAHMRGFTVTTWCAAADRARVLGEPFAPSLTPAAPYGERSSADMVWHHLRVLRKDLTALRTEARNNNQERLANQFAGAISRTMALSKQMTMALDEASKRGAANGLQVP